MAKNCKSPSSLAFVHFMWNISNKKKYAKSFVGLVLKILNRNHKNKKQAKLDLGYVEGHHILPVSFDPTHSKTETNIIYCTAREHFVIHLLMTRMFSSRKLEGLSKSAITGFTMKNSKQNRDINSWEFEQLRKLAAHRLTGNTNGAKTKGYTFYTDGKTFTFCAPGSEPPGFYPGNPNKGKIRITNGKVNSNIDPGEDVPEGWWVGSCNKGKPSKCKGRRYHYSPEKREATNELIRASQLQYIWITDGYTSFRLKRTEEIPAGWYRGRAQLGPSKLCCLLCQKVYDLGNFTKHKQLCKGKL